MNRVHGGHVTYVPVQIRKSGPIHRVRFMVLCLYLLQICLYQNQFITYNQNIQDVMILPEYIGLIHAPYFLKSPLAIIPPRNASDLWVDLAAYRKCFHVTMRQSRMIKAIQECPMNHLWYC